MLLDKYEETTELTKYVTHIYKERDFYGNEYIEGNVWADDGSTSILSGNFKSVEDFKAKEKVAKANFEKGLIRCSDCGKVTGYNPIRYHRYFAGIYCTACWEREWKEREANETYN